MRRAQIAAMALAMACAGDTASANGTGATTAPPPPAAPAAPAAAPPAPAPPGTASFTPDDIKPYFTPGTVAGDAAARFVLEDYPAARDGFARALAAPDAPADAAGRARLGFMIALCDAKLEHWPEAAAGFDAALPALPLLADYINYEAARAWFFAHDYDKAQERVARVAKGAWREFDARLLAADLLRVRADAKPKWKPVAAAYEAYLADFPNGPRRAEAQFHLGEAYEALGRAVPDAVNAYRVVIIRSPIDEWGEHAMERFVALMLKVPEKQRAKYTMLTAAEHMTRGKVLFDGMRNPLSEGEYAAALTASGLDAHMKCEAMYQQASSVFKQRQRMRSAPLFEATVDACAATDDVDMQMKSIYQVGRAYQYADAGDDASTKKSIAAFARAEKWHPEHSFADDARLRQAEGWAKLPRSAETDAQITELLSKIPTLYPTGDMRGEALWRLAWRDWKDGKYESAIGWLDQQITSVPRDYNWWGEGQAQYWKGRAYAKLGKKAAALASYQEGVRKYPLAYYSLLALNRLREGWPKEFAQLVAELKQPPAGWKKGTPVFTFKPRAVFAEPGFQRAVELVRLGLGDDAQAELARLGLRVPDGRKQVTDPDRAEELWATALLYDRAQQYDKSHWIARWSVLDYKDAWPTEANRARWEIAYPKAWWGILDPAAKLQGYPTELLIAFVREESAFDPILESFANAIGLTQMINSTATRFGKGLGFPMTRENLRDPVKNVAVGSRFLAFLWKTFDTRITLLVPSYNAGEGATWRWLCERGGWAADEFNEAIPHDEARNYSKRVINSFFVYSYLKDGTIPVLPNDIPPALINQKRCKGGAAN
jgi:soluble lytic murein transglycosylase